MRAFRTIFCAVTIGCGALWTYGADRVQAEGAIAFGSTGSVAKDGYSIGINVNSSTEADAKRKALAWCRTHGSQVTQRECKIVTTFSPSMRGRSAGSEGRNAGLRLGRRCGRSVREKRGDGSLPGDRGKPPRVLQGRQVSLRHHALSDRSACRAPDRSDFPKILLTPLGNSIHVELVNTALALQGGTHARVVLASRTGSGDRLLHRLSGSVHGVCDVGGAIHPLASARGYCPQFHM